MSHSPGKKFEEDFIKSVPDRCDITRLKDAGGWSNATNLRFTIKNPCDFIIYSRETRTMYKLELKSVAGKSMPFSNIKPKKQHRNKFIKDLCDSHERGVSSAFIINFRGKNETYMIYADEMRNLIENCGRKSISIVDASCNGIKIEQSLIRVRWRYNLEWL